MTNAELVLKLVEMLLKEKDEAIKEKQQDKTED